MRLISTINRSLGFKAKIYYNSEYSEYKVLFFNEDGIKLPDSDYFTDDKQDALDTAQLQLQFMVDRMESV